MQGVKGTPKVLMAIAFVVAAQLVFTYAPLMQKWFGTSPLSLWQLFEAAIAGVVVLVILEIEKTLLRRFHLQENQ
jgi:magnesium-transporting ATPase (P-type)